MAKSRARIPPSAPARHGLESEIGPGGARLDAPQEGGVHRGERDIDSSDPPRCAIAVSSSTSRTMPADFVVMPTRSPGTRAIASST